MSTLVARDDLALSDPTAHADPAPVLDHLRRVIDHAVHLLPAQGPITVFIHHNTLHAFEDLPFDEAVVRGARVFGCQPYLSEDRFRAELAKGRIRFADLRAVLANDLGGLGTGDVAGLATRFELRLAMLQHPLPVATTDELLWYVAETDALRKVRADVSASVRGRLIAETRRWVMRDLRGNGREVPEWVPRHFARFDETDIEGWDDGTWEAFTLQALWQVCRDGVAGVPPAECGRGPLCTSVANCTL